MSATNLIFLAIAGFACIVVLALIASHFYFDKLVLRLTTRNRELEAHNSRLMKERQVLRSLIKTMETKLMGREAAIKAAEARGRRDALHAGRFVR